MASDVVQVSLDVAEQRGVYLWTVRGLSSLTRRNKLSSRRFVAPEQQVGETPPVEFRFVLLRGIVKAADPKDDPLALFLELAPGQAAPARMGVTIEVMTLTGDVVVTDAADVEFGASVPVLDFRDIVKADALARLDGDGLCVQATLRFNKTLSSDLWTAGLGLGRSMWASASKAVTTVVDAVRTQAVAAAAEREESRPCPWDDVPPKWSTTEERAAQWTFLLTTYLTQTDATFVYGRRQFTSEEEFALTQTGLSARACEAAGSDFDFDRDVTETLLQRAPEALRSMRFSLVPARVTEEEFWANYFWRIAGLRLCDNDEQAKVFISVANAPQLPQRQDRAASAANSPSGDTSPHATSPQAAHVQAHDETLRDTIVERCEHALSLAHDVLSDSAGGDDDAHFRQAAVDGLKSAIAAAADVATDEALSEAVAKCEAALDALARPREAEDPAARPAAVALSESFTTDDATPASPAASPAEEDEGAQGPSEPSGVEPAATASSEAREASGTRSSAVLMPWEEEED